MRKLPFPLIVIALLIGALALAACGSSKKKSSSASTSSSSSGQPTTLSISASEQGKKASYSAPATVKGGLVTVTFQNNGKAPHSAQLAKIDGNHSPQEVLKAIGGNSSKTPPWIHGEGGPGSTNPGQTGTSTDILPAGNYLIVDGGNMNGPPGFKKLTVTSGPSGSLPSTGTSVTATAPAKDKYKWQINGPPPKFLDQKSFTSTSVLDGTNKSEVTQLSLARPGKYVLFCPLTDRDGGKPHLAEGLLTTVNVK